MKYMKIIAVKQVIVILLFVVLILNVLTFNSSGETIEKFGDGTTQKEIEFHEAGTDSNTYVSLPKRAEITKAKIKITSENIDNPKIDFGNDENIEWKYEKIYGTFGEQNKFSRNNKRNSTSTINFVDQSFDAVTKILLPKNANVKQSNFDISGKYMQNESFSEIEVLTGNTDQGRDNFLSSIAVAKNENLYVAWHYMWINQKKPLFSKNMMKIISKVLK